MKLRSMKKIHVIALVMIALAIAVLISFMGDVTTYDTIAVAKNKPGKSVTLVARVDKTLSMDYDPVKNPNYLSFTALDTLGNAIKVIYHSSKPADMEKSERIVLKGSVQGDHFECKDILLKCPSKYKDANATKQKLNTSLWYNNSAKS